MKHEIHIGKPNEDCASCRRAFNKNRKPAESVRVVYPRLSIPVMFEYAICGDCLTAFKKGGKDRNRVIDAIDDYHEGKGVKQ